jgi:protoporphyrinogen oxidase
MKILIIGAGPAGLSCAYELVKAGRDVEVFEASEYVGGMSRSFDLWGQRVDVGPHRFFSKEKKVNSFFYEVLKDDFIVVNRLTRIRYDSRFFSYPLKLGNVFKNLNLLTIVRILWDYFKQTINPIKNPLTFEDWVTNKFGKKLFKMFFKSYSEKLWGIPCSEIDADWAAQRIKTLSLFKAVVSAVKSNRGNDHKTLIDQFNYPNNGTGELYEKCSKYIIENGGKIHLNKPVREVLIDDSNSANGLKLNDGTVIYADIIVSSMPITNLVKGLKRTPRKVKQAVDSLYYRNTILVYLEVDGLDLFDDNWIYVHSEKVKHGRITNFRNWSPTLNKGKETTILCLEFWTSQTDDLWNETDEEISIIAQNEIRSLNLFSNELGINNSHVLRVPKSYPVYQIGYKEKLEMVYDFLDEIKSLMSIGRYGAFKYNNQDHSILMGLLAAHKIINGNTGNLWDVNSDQEYQEEMSN